MSLGSFLKKLLGADQVQPGGKPPAAPRQAPAKAREETPLPTAENISTFFGLPVKDYDWNGPAAEIGSTAYRLRIDFETHAAGVIPEGDASLPVFRQVLNRFLASPSIDTLTALVIGDWGGSGTGGDSAAVVVEALVDAKAQLPNLRALFVGDIVMEEAEISWIQQSDLSPLWQAYPGLELVQVRGGSGLSLGTLALAKLHTLVIQTGGLSAEVVRQVAAAKLPELRHLELWLGSDEYGGNSQVRDLQPILAGDAFPKLEYLGLRDCDYADPLAVAVAGAPVLERLKTLDLSLGTLSDAGGAALLAAEAAKRLQRLDLHFHYLSDEMMANLAALGPAVNVSDQQEADEWDGKSHRYVAVSE